MKISTIRLWTILMYTVIVHGYLYKWSGTENNSYFISGIRASYDEATEKCFNNFNGYLASFEGLPHGAPFLSALRPEASYFIGVYYDAEDNYYKWQDSRDVINYMNVTELANMPRGERCVVFYNETYSWELKNANCTEKFHYICKSYDPTCYVTNVKGFKHQPQYNGNYTIHWSSQSKYDCDLTKPIYVKNFGGEFICYNGVDFSLSFYGSKTEYDDAFFYTSIPFPHLLEFDDRGQYEEEKQGNWTEAVVKVTCLAYNVPAANIIVDTSTTADYIHQNHTLTIYIVCATLSALVIMAALVVVIWGCRKHRNTDKDNAPTVGQPYNVKLNTFAINIAPVHNEDDFNDAMDTHDVDNSTYMPLNKGQMIYVNEDVNVYKEMKLF